MEFASHETACAGHGKHSKVSSILGSIKEYLLSTHS
jgi:hypothetical protein